MLALLGAAFWQWQRMTGELERITDRLRQSAAEQQRLQRRLEETRVLLERQRARLERLESRNRGEEPP